MFLLNELTCVGIYVMIVEIATRLRLNYMMITTALNSFAKILAAENITILVDSSLNTAYFDMANRTMYLPDWANLTENQQILLRSHEVGHALHTPAQGWHDAVVPGKDGKQNKGMRIALNITEDARIERKMKEEFPGLRKRFVDGYKEFLDSGIFDIKQEEIPELGLLDRFNMHFKLGHLVSVPFSSDEQVLVNEGENTKTFEESLDLAKKLYQKDKESRTSKLNKDKKKGKGDGEGEGEDDNDGDEDGEEDISKTDGAFRKNEQKLAKKSNTNITKNIRYTKESHDSLKKCVVSITENEFAALNSYVDSKSSTREPEMVSKFFAEAKAAANVINTFFEMKKAAHNNQRTRENKTGTLNLSKLHKYTFSSDIFLSNQMVPIGKNHGLVMFIDFSGSMSGNIGATMRQLIALQNFCTIQNIPHEIYAFYVTNVHRGQAHEHKNCMTYDSGTFRMLKMFSSGYSKKLTKILRSFFAKWALTSFRESDINRAIPEARYSANNTPLNHAVFACADIVRSFKAETGIEVVHPVFLTDGGGGDGVSVAVPSNKKTNATTYDEEFVGRYESVNYTDELSGVTFTDSLPSGESKAISMLPLQMLKASGYNPTNFFVCGDVGAANGYTQFFTGKGLNSYIDYAKNVSLNEIFTKRGGCVIEHDDIGMSQLYLLNNLAEYNIKEETSKVGDSTKKLEALLQKNGGTDRIVLKNFVEQICSNF